MIINAKSAIREPTEVDRWCSAFESLCRLRGIRVTAQRLAVYRVLAEDASHPTAESVYSQLRRRLPSVSQATVYRILEFLEQQNLIRSVGSTDGAGRFDANLSPHQHLVCRVCGSMSDISAPALYRATLPAVSGFTVEEVDIRLVGRCQKCSRRRPDTRRRRRLPRVKIIGRRERRNG